MNLTSKEINKIIMNSKASMAIEGFKVTEEEEELVRKHLSGEITEEELFNRLKAGMPNEVE
ncbi:antitoxin VbhA family protein [Dehalobacter sp. TeCB1]|uniref:antitoxin VbhA family protein n=1 Tax=Dehalobacter sp. TeCB1 TaxID=1843715 RepID=UPI00083B622F|nr:antitoxin VbhA family protein [Dehalobacter sp. TeCB1]OCZ51337.1 hypothetical protein A7D23_13010 [Dehalobacter sp. TeCB1]